MGEEERKMKSEMVWNGRKKKRDGCFEVMKLKKWWSYEKCSGVWLIPYSLLCYYYNPISLSLSFCFLKQCFPSHPSRTPSHYTCLFYSTIGIPDSTKSQALSQIESGVLKRKCATVGSPEGWREKHFLSMHANCSSISDTLPSPQHARLNSATLPRV